MALSKTLTAETGVQVNDAYFRVENLVVTPKQSMTFLVRGYVSTDYPAFYNKDFNCGHNLDNGNVIAQAYEHLKTLPEFSGATDC